MFEYILFAIISFVVWSLIIPLIKNVEAKKENRVSVSDNSVFLTAIIFLFSLIPLVNSFVMAVGILVFIVIGGIRLFIWLYDETEHQTLKSLFNSFKSKLNNNNTDTNKH